MKIRPQARGLTCPDTKLLRKMWQCAYTNTMPQDKKTNAPALTLTWSKQAGTEPVRQLSPPKTPESPTIHILFFF